MRKAIIFIIPVLLLVFRAAGQEFTGIEIKTDLGNMGQ